MSAVFIGPTPRCLLDAAVRLHVSILRFVKASGDREDTGGFNLVE